MMRFGRLVALGGAVLGILAGAAAHAETVFMVQLGTFKSDSEATTQWQKLSKDFPDLFEPLTYSPTEVTLPPDDFVYHRNQAGPIPTRSEAEEICTKLLSKDYECYVVETAMFTAPVNEAKGPVKKEEPAADPVPESLASGPEQEPSEEDKGIYSYINTMPAPLTPLEESASSSAAAEELPAPPVPVEEKEEARVEMPPPPPPPAPEVKPVAPPPPPPAPAPAPDTSMPWGSEKAPEQAAVTPPPPPPPPAAMPPVAPTETMVPMMPESTSDRAQVQVGEAIPVPLSTPQAPAAKLGRGGINTARPSVSLGYPSQLMRGASLWAEISHFKTEQGALGYWNTLRNRDTALPNGLRLRVTRPFLRTGTAQKLSLRVGPFSNVESIRRLCRATRPENLNCRAIKDLGSSINSASLSRERTSQTRYRMQQNRQYVKPATASFGGGSVYWMQLGSFMAPQAAHDKWQEMSRMYNDVLAHTSHQIYVPQRTSGAMLYRLRAGPYSSAGDAIATCESLKARGGICAVVKD